jgi:glycolate oxidase iron-sulfur subunit
MRTDDERTQEFSERFEEYTRTLDCVHCGLCIQECPTYELTGREADNPRGRIYLMRGYAEGTGEMTSEALRHLDECIVCRACESVCPSGIRMGEMMEGFRHELDKGRRRKGLRYRFARILLRHVLPHRDRIALISDVLWFYQWIGLRRLVDLVLRLLPRRLVRRVTRLHAMQPTIPHPRERRVPTSESLPAGVYPAEGTCRMRVGLFLGCVASEWFAATCRATIRVLQKNGCDVVVPDAQTCCGALSRHAGVLDEADVLYRRNADVFARASVDVIVTNAAGCGAALKEPTPSARDGLGAPVRDICEFLDEIGIVAPQGELPVRVAYDQPCHLQHGQRIGASVVENLLRMIPKLELVPLEDSDRCCGSGGVYNLVQPDIAEQLRDQKAEKIRAASVDVVVTGNPGCEMQIRVGLDETGIEVTHPVELLDRSYRAES